MLMKLCTVFTFVNFSGKANIIFICGLDTMDMGVKPFRYVCLSSLLKNVGG